MLTLGEGNYSTSEVFWPDEAFTMGLATIIVFDSAGTAVEYLSENFPNDTSIRIGVYVP